jgi:hypothetical protein
MPDFGPTVDDVGCLVRGAGATLRISHPGTVTSEIAGSLALWAANTSTPPEKPQKDP